LRASPRPGPACLGPCTARSAGSRCPDERGSLRDGPRWFPPRAGGLSGLGRRARAGRRGRDWRLRGAPL